MEKHYDFKGLYEKMDELDDVRLKELSSAYSIIKDKNNIIDTQEAIHATEINVYKQKLKKRGKSSFLIGVGVTVTAAIVVGVLAN